MNQIAALFHRLTLGVYVVGAAHANRRNAFTAAWVMQVSYNPLLRVLSINPDHASYPLLRASGGFTINVLKQGQLELARRFGTRSGRVGDKLAGVAWRPGRDGAPLLEGVLAYFECELTESVRAGDHDLTVGRVIRGKILDCNAAPMTYAETGATDGSNALYPASF